MSFHCTEQEQLFLVTLVETLERDGCHPALLRNYDHFPSEIGNDLDIYVTKSAFNTASITLAKVVERFSGTIIHVHFRSYFRAYWIRLPHSEKEIHIDLYPGAATWHGLDYIEEARLETDMKKRSAYRVLRPGHEAATLLLASILWGGFYKTAYHGMIKSLLASPDEKKVFQSLILRVFEKEGHDWLIELINEASPKLWLPITKVKMLRRNLINSSIRNHGLSAIIQWFAYWKNEVWCMLSSPGIILKTPVSHSSQVPEVIERVEKSVGHLFGSSHTMKEAPSNPLMRCFWKRRILAKNHLLINTIEGKDEPETSEELKLRVLNLLQKRRPVD